jgi:1-deoxy-D-xylulose-5-phosphate synthase
MDEARVIEAARDHQLLVTVEENSIAGGGGSAVAEYLSSQNIPIDILHLGLPDQFIEHAKPDQQRAQAGLDSQGITQAIHDRMAQPDPFHQLTERVGVQALADIPKTF